MIRIERESIDNSSCPGWRRAGRPARVAPEGASRAASRWPMSGGRGGGDAAAECVRLKDGAGSKGWGWRRTGGRRYRIGGSLEVLHISSQTFTIFLDFLTNNRDTVVFQRTP
jgi:hypothetical protein